MGIGASRVLGLNLRSAMAVGNPQPPMQPVVATMLGDRWVGGCRHEL